MLYEVITCLGQAGENRAFAKGQVLDVLVEIVLGRSLYPVGAVPEVDLVEVEVEDIALGQRVLHAPGEDRLLELPLELLLRGQQERLGDSYNFV